MSVQTLADRLSAKGIEPKDLRAGNQKMLCPECSHKRRNRNDLCLSLTIDGDGAVWKCHNCDFAGAVSDRNEGFTPQPRAPVRITKQPGALPAHAIAWFATREISEESLAYAGVGWSDNRGAVVFPYRRPGVDAIVNAKFRRLPKDGFSQIKDGEKVYWLLDKLDRSKSGDLYIVEGEMDALAMIEAGIHNVLSVPDGAPKQVTDERKDSKKFSFVPDCLEWTEPFERIILAVDRDDPGEALAEELARRYGKERCWRVEWPTGTKDANDYLIEFGKVSLAERCRAPVPWPVEGLFGITDYTQDVMRLFREGRARGASTGLPSIDRCYTVAPGQVTTVTGVPSHGKSEFIDQLMINLARAQGWAFAICSFENDPPDHIVKLVEKWTHLPFWDGPRLRMTSWNLEKALEDVTDTFHFIRSDGEGEAPTVDWILGKARVLVMRFGIRGLVVDPYNEIEHRRPDNMTETEYVSLMLSKFKRFAVQHGVHVWFVAHPAKLRVERGVIPIPTLYDISGSANFANKTDVGIVVHRGAEKGTTEVYFRKVRFKWVGQQGKVTLSYDLATGTYSDLGMVEFA